MALKELLPGGYERREAQLQLAEECGDFMMRGETYVTHAPCGLGKSLAALMAALPLLEEKRLFVTYRTRSQLDIYLKELRELDPSSVAVSTVSKRDMCPRLDSGYSDFQRSCSRLRKNTRRGEDPYCPEFLSLVEDPEGCRREALDGCSDFLTPMQFYERASRAGICPYESLKLVMPEADVFLGTYHYLLDPGIRAQVLNALEADLDDLVVVGDEAHNLPSFARSLLSRDLTGRTLNRAVSEAEEHRKEDALEVLERLDGYFHHLERALADREARRASPEEVAGELPGTASSAVQVLEEAGGEIWEERFAESGNGFSYVKRTGEFVSEFLGKNSPEYVHWAARRGSPSLELDCLDGKKLTEPVLEGAHSAVLMSGTLTPVEVYRDLITGSDAVAREHPSPFPSRNRSIIVARDVSSKMDERTDEGFDRMAAHVEAVADRNEGNVAVFATSYSNLGSLEKRVDTERRLIVEERGAPVSPVIGELSSVDDALLMGVMGGKLSEGIDYEGDMLTSVVAAGFPYPPWGGRRRALIEYLDERFDGRGRLYGYLVPAVTRLLQTCGRVHRSAEDRGTIVVLDRRVLHRYVRKRLPDDFSGEMQPVSSPYETAREVERFWRSRG